MNIATAVMTSTLALSDPIVLGDVIRSVEEFHPLVRAAQEGIDAARGTLIESQGSFDTYVTAKGKGYGAGYYDGVALGLEARQPTTFWGSEFYVGYRYGADHPIYDGGKLTSRGGEVIGGVMIPLWRNGPIDERRTRIRQAEAGVDLATMEARSKLIETKLKAAVTYWKWVAAHEKLRIVASMQTLAEQRAKGLRRRVERGDIARIELIDNERLIVSRLESVVEARREVQRTAFELSLFLRDDAGEPVVPTIGEAPDLPQPESLPAFDRTTIGQAIERRPEVAWYDAMQTQLEAAIAQANNARAPRIDLGIEGSKDLSDPRAYGPDPKERTRNETALGLSLSFSLPVQQRKAIGKARSASAKLRAVKAKQGFLRDSIATQARDAWSALETARARIGLARRTLELTKTVEFSERRRFELGASSILNVNLREEASAKAAKALVGAIIRSHTASARFRAVVVAL